MILGDRAEVSARVLNKAGQVLDRAVAWSVQAPALVTVLSSSKTILRFKARQNGVTTIRATVSGKAGATKLVIRDAAGARLMLSPASSAVPVRGTLRFTVSGRTKAGEAVTLSAAWTATGGTVSDGLYMAGWVPAPIALSRRRHSARRTPPSSR